MISESFCLKVYLDKDKRKIFFMKTQETLSGKCKFLTTAFILIFNTIETSISLLLVNTNF